MECEQVNGQWKGMLASRPWFWFKKCVQDGLLSQQDQDEWSTYMSIFKDSNQLENQTTVGLNTFVETKLLFRCKTSQTFPFNYLRTYFGIFTYMYFVLFYMIFVFYKV